MSEPRVEPVRRDPGEPLPTAVTGTVEPLGPREKGLPTHVFTGVALGIPLILLGALIGFFIRHHRRRAHAKEPS